MATHFGGDEVSSAKKRGFTRKGRIHITLGELATATGNVSQLCGRDLCVSLEPSLCAPVVTTTDSKHWVVFRVEAQDRCYVELHKRSLFCGWNRHWQDPRRAARSMFAGTRVARPIYGGRTAYVSYEIERPFLVARVARSLKSRMFAACRNIVFDELADSPASMAKNYLGCSLSALVEKLEQRFSDGMDWNSSGALPGQPRWVIDHIMPLASFDFRKISHVRKACHHSNLRPCWELENIRKKDRMPSLELIELSQKWRHG